MHIAEAKTFAETLQAKYHLCIPSMQSIWYGRQEALFGTDAERAALLAYTKEAIMFASALSCKNLVFGCPRNRARQGRALTPVVAFFRSVAEAAEAAGVVFSLEANPPIYHTDYLNRTEEVLDLAEEMASPGLRVNLDLGTMMENGETAQILRGRTHLIQHVHLSEPYLKPIVPRRLHEEVAAVLRDEGYQGFVSLEMGRQETLEPVKTGIAYLGRCSSVFQRRTRAQKGARSALDSRHQ